MASTKKNPTIYDVARLSGVSITTISRVLNAPMKVNPTTRAKVLEVIDQLGYRPNAVAHARTLRRNARIGVITPFFSAPAFVQRLRGIAETLSTISYELVIYTVSSEDQLQGYLASLPLTGDLAGLIVLSLPIGDSDADRLLEHSLPTVLIEFPHRKLNSVEIDDIEGGRMATEYLLNKGHRRIAFLGDTDLPEYSIHPVGLRLTGFRSAMKYAGIHVPRSFVRLAPYTQEQTRQVATELLNLPEPPTAIFAATDFQALGVLKVAHQLGVKIPGDLAVIGFDDLDMAEYADLTTVSQHLDESGKLATDVLLRCIDEPSRLPQHMRISLTLVERATA